MARQAVATTPPTIKPPFRAALSSCWCDACGPSRPSLSFQFARSWPKGAAHWQRRSGAPPFNPRQAVQKFVGVLKEYGINRVQGDAYAGQTFRSDFESEGVRYEVADMSSRHNTRV